MNSIVMKVTATMIPQRFRAATVGKGIMGMNKQMLLQSTSKEVERPEQDAAYVHPGKFSYETGADINCNIQGIECTVEIDLNTQKCNSSDIQSAIFSHTLFPINPLDTASPFFSGLRLKYSFYKSVVMSKSHDLKLANVNKQSLGVFRPNKIIIVDAVDSHLVFLSHHNIISRSLWPVSHSLQSHMWCLIGFIRSASWSISWFMLCIFTITVRCHFLLRNMVL